MNDLLSIQNFSLAIHYENRILPILHEINLHIETGERVGLVGESGSGKSSLAKAILRLHEFNYSLLTEGGIFYKGENLLGMDAHGINSIRGNEISIVFQDPLSSMNPMFKVRKQIAEVLIHHKGVSHSDADDLIYDTFRELHLTPPERFMNAYPFQLSGGQCQRVMIAMALITVPKLLIADEITSSLDAIISEEILELLDSYSRKQGTSVLMISHNLHTVRKFVDRIGILYAGQLVECLNCYYLPERAWHPYTRALFYCADAKRDEKGRFKSIDGYPPKPEMNIKGCPFYSRCEYHTDICREEMPSSETETGDWVKCHHADQIRNEQ
ncbi:MAG: ABC transporter ATP-binding protein [Candidatus Electryonea clarkiae]|nr:ABC transporter ATP-binding protein [Candidatus Electryonea clarkiae]